MKDHNLNEGLCMLRGNLTLLVFLAILMSACKGGVSRVPQDRDPLDHELLDGQVIQILHGTLERKDSRTGLGTSYDSRLVGGTQGTYLLYSTQAEQASVTHEIYEKPDLTAVIQNSTDPRRPQNRWEGTLVWKSILSGRNPGDARFRDLEMVRNLSPGARVAPEVGILECPQLLFTNGQKIPLILSSEPLSLQKATSFEFAPQFQDHSRILQELQSDKEAVIQATLRLGPVLPVTRYTFRLRTKPILELLAQKQSDLGHLKDLTRDHVREIITTIPQEFYARTILRHRELALDFERQMIDHFFALETYQPEEPHYVLRSPSELPSEIEVSVSRYLAHAAARSIPISIPAKVFEPGPTSIGIEAQPMQNPMIPGETRGHQGAVQMSLSKGEYLQIELEALQMITLQHSKFESRSSIVEDCLKNEFSCEEGAWSCVAVGIVEENCRMECLAGWVRDCPVGPRLGAGLDGSTPPWTRDSFCGDRCRRPLERVCNQVPRCHRISPPALPRFPVVWNNETPIPTSDQFRFQCNHEPKTFCKPENKVLVQKVETRFSDTLPKERLLVRASDRFGQGILRGIQIHFSGGVVCPLSQLQSTLWNADRFLVKMEATSHCPIPFYEGVIKLVGVTVHQKTPLRQRCGTLKESSSGKREYECLLDRRDPIRLNSTRKEDQLLEEQGKESGIWVDYAPHWSARFRLSRFL